MTAAAVAVFLITATVSGYAVVRATRNDLACSEILGWSFAAGLLVQAIIEVSILAIGLVPGPKKILAAEAALVASTLILRRRSKTVRAHGARRGSGIVTSSLLIFAAIGVLLFFCVAMTEPISATDFFAIWGLKGRIIFETASIPSRLFHDATLLWDHPEYPMLLPVSLAALASAARAWDDRALALLYPFCQLATVGALYGFLSRRVSREAGAFAACLTAACFPLYSAGNLGLAEVPMALGFVLAASAAADAVSQGSPARCVRLAIASLFCAATKQEGALFVLLLVGYLLLHEQGRKKPLWLWAGMPLLLHGASLRLLRGPVVRRDYDLTLLAPHRSRELLARLGEVARHLLKLETRGAAIVIGIVVLFLLLTRKGSVDWLALPLGTQVLCYAFLCALSAFGAVWLLEASFRRIVISLIPTFILVLASRLEIPMEKASSQAPAPRMESTGRSVDAC